MWALAEIQERFEVRFAEGGFEATRSLRDEVVDPLVDLYLQRFARRDEENESALVEEERHLLETLWALRDPRALPAAVAAAELGIDREFPRRVHLATAIVRSAGVPVRERAALSRYLISKAKGKPSAMEGCVALLGEVPGEVARSALESLVEDAPAPAASAALWRLALRAEPESIPVVSRAMFRIHRARRGVPVAEHAQRSVVLFGSRAFEAILRLATTPEAEFVAAAAELRSSNPLGPLFGSAEDFAVRAGIRALGHLGDPRGVERLLVALDPLEPNVDLWLEAADSLVMLAEPDRFTGPIVESIGGDISTPLVSVAEVLTGLGTEESMAAAMSILPEEPPSDMYLREDIVAELWVSGSAEERSLLVNHAWAAEEVASFQQSEDGQFLERCGENLDCYMEPFEQCGELEVPCERALQEFYLAPAGAVLRRFARGNTDISIRLISLLNEAQSSLLREEIHRTVAAIAADDDDVLKELERRAAKGFRDLITERLRRRFRTRRGLPVVTPGADDQPIGWSVDPTLAGRLQ